MNSGRLMRVPEVAEILGVNPEAVRTFIRRGELAAFKIGRGTRSGYRIAEADLDAYLAARRKEAWNRPR